MGKVRKKLTPQKNENQRKISSFFQEKDRDSRRRASPGSSRSSSPSQALVVTPRLGGEGANSVKSQLFSTSHTFKAKPTADAASLVPSRSHKIIPPAESEDDEVILIADSPQTVAKKPKLTLSNRSLLQNKSESVSCSNGETEKKNSDSAVMLQNKRITSNCAPSSTSPVLSNPTTCVPDTQLISSFPSPTGKVEDKSIVIDSDTQVDCKSEPQTSTDDCKMGKIVDSSFDGDMIPDTPDVPDKTISKRRMPPSNRSFLSSSSILKQPQFQLGLNKSRLKAQKQKQQSARTFEDAYREMMNSKGEPLEKADLNLVLGPLHNSPSTFIEPKETVKSPPAEASPSLISSKSSVDCKSASDIQNHPTRRRKLGSSKPVSTLGVLSGVKRSSSHGESPNAKRPDCRKSRTPGKHNAEKPQFELSENMPCKRKLSLNKKCGIGKSTKSQMWDLSESVCEKDDVLSDILGELKQGTSDEMSGVHASRASKTDTEHQRESSTDLSIDDSSDVAENIKHPATDADAVAMDTGEADSMLMDIMSELQQTLTPCSNKFRSVTGKRCGKPLQSFNKALDLPSDTASSKLVKTQKTPVKKSSPLMKNKPIHLQKNKSHGTQGKQTESTVCDSLKYDLVNSPESNKMNSNPSSCNLMQKSVPENKCIDIEMCVSVNEKNSSGRLSETENKNVCQFRAKDQPGNAGISQVKDIEMEENKENISTENLPDELCKDFEEMSPFKSPQPRRELPPKEEGVPLCAHFGRHEVIAVHKSRDEIVLDVKAVIGGALRTVSLQGFWTDVHLCEGDIVHVIGEFDSSGHCCVTDKQNLLVVQPDTLVSGTTIVSSLYCMRRSVLSERFKGVDAKNHYMLYGSIIHSFFQMVMQDKAVTATSMRLIASKIVQQTKFLHDMYGMGMDEEKVLAEIETYMPHVVKFVEKHATYAAGLASPPENEVAVTRVADIEENIWSPRYGIKGKIDLTVEVKIHDKPRGWSKKLMPLELKTGKASFSSEHKGQVTLYSMMTSDRREDPGAGLLLYLRGGSMKTIPADVANQRGLVQLRNEMVHHMLKGLQWSEDGPAWSGGLPAPINSQRACSKCPQLINCALYQKTVENWQAPEKHAMLNLVPEATDHLSPSHLEYYTKWIQLLHREMAASKKDDTAPREIWCKTPAKREEQGFCISGLVLVEAVKVSDPSEPELYCLTFRRKTQKIQSLALNEVGLGQGDSVVLSGENRPLIALVQSNITHISETSVSVYADRDLRAYEADGKLTYRLDKCNSYNVMGINFTNLTKLMQSTASSEKLRQLVIDKRVPEFDVKMSKSKIEQVKELLKTLNKPQKTAILKVLMCNDYILIKGYPGTGKTSTIVTLVQSLVILGFSVLLTSYTHSAVDNILLKLKKHNVDFIRLGRRERIHPDIQSYSADHLTANIKTVAELAEFYASKSVVATTCLGVNHAVFSQRVFDICIVDEASQVMQPACLGPLFCSQRFVLVGDPLQLPPVVISRHAREGGMSESLFARLDDTGGTYELNLQYRMNSEIMRLSNELVYSGALKCGSPAVATHCIPSPERLSAVLDNHEEWVKKALTPDAGHEVVFLNTDKVEMPDVSKDANITNVVEAQIILKMIKICMMAGMNEESFGIITPYRQQVRLIRGMLVETAQLSKVEVNTVDQYQGRDKSIIIVSFVKHSTNGPTSEILKDVRRLNVALTRAKHKLILLGSQKTLTQYEALGKLIKLLRPEQISLLTD